MPVNVEIKARTSSFAQQIKIAENLSDTRQQIIDQEDTFFNVPRGRLKLRIFEPGRGELIYYERPDDSRVRTSHYIISQTLDPDSLKAALGAAIGIAGVVRKKRRLYKVGQTRIHLDEVEGLGQFIEFEYVLKEDEKLESAEAAVRGLLERFQILPQEIIANAYVDLIKTVAD